MNTDITQRIHAYRECARHLWNTYFLTQLSDDVSHWDISDEFEDICSMLFSSLVLNPIGATEHKKSPGYESNPQPLLCLHIVPISDVGETSIHINREKMKAYGYWDYSINGLSPLDIDLRFIDCFDFDKLGYKNFEYYMGRVVHSPTHLELIGRNALVRASCVRILFEDG